MATSSYGTSTETVVVRDVGPLGALRRISWGAVIAGVVLALVVQLLLGMLGLGIGMSTVDPTAGDTPSAQAFGVGAAVWWVVTSLIALFIGGWVACHLAGVPQRLDGTLHGLLAWAVTTLLTLYLLTTAVGNVLSGTFGVLGSVASGAGQAIGAVAPRAGEALQREMQDRGIGLEDIRREAMTLLRQTGKPELQPENVQRQAQETLKQGQQAAGTAAQQPAATDEEAQSLLDRVLSQAQGTASAADREALINVVMARTGQTREQAEQTVANWESQYQQAQARVEQLKTQTAEQARQTADQAAGAVTQAALWSFAGLLLAAIAAGVGGALGRPRELVRTVV
jgi:hypothetical protein